MRLSVQTREAAALEVGTSDQLRRLGPATDCSDPTVAATRAAKCGRSGAGTSRALAGVWGDDGVAVYELQHKDKPEEKHR